MITKKRIAIEQFSKYKAQRTRQDGFSKNKEQEC